jgi:hypothetical protein
MVGLYLLFPYVFRTSIFAFCPPIPDTALNQINHHRLRNNRSNSTTPYNVNKSCVTSDVNRGRHGNADGSFQTKIAVGERNPSRNCYSFRAWHSEYEIAAEECTCLTL